jgi:NAD(P)-dependent dehydrogenase (short-subunit alcohol dehydrogenase family)
MDPSVADGVVAEIAASGGSAAAAYENLEEAGAGARLVDLAVARFGRLDALIHNAESGMVISAAGGRFSAARWDHGPTLDLGPDAVSPEDIATRWRQIIVPRPS